MIKKIRTSLDRYQNQIFFSLIILFAIILRFYNLASMPKNLSFNEIEILKEAKTLISNGWIPKSNQFFDLIYLYLVAGLGYLSSFNIIVIKIFQILISVSTIILFYVFIKNWFNKKIALLGVLFISIDVLDLIMTRTINSSLLIPTTLISLLLVTTLALRSKKSAWFILLGSLVGLSLYVNQIFVLIPIVIAISFVSFYQKNHLILNSYWKQYLLMALSAIIISLPYLYHLPQNINSLVSYFNPGSFGNYLINFGDIWRSLIYQSDYAGYGTIGLEPILGPFIAITFLCGLAYAVAHLERRKYFFLTAFLLLSMTALALLNNQNAFSLIFIVPIVLILSSVILDYLLTVWFKTFPLNKNAKLVLTIILSFFIFLSVYYNYEKFFYAWGKNDYIQQQFDQKFIYKK